MNSSFAKNKTNLRENPPCKECQNLDEDDDLPPVENLRLNCDEFEDFDFICEKIKTTNITPYPLTFKKNPENNRKDASSEIGTLIKFEDSYENEATNSTFVEHKCLPLKLELSPIADDETFRNLTITDTSSDWYTIEQWKIDRNSTKSLIRISNNEVVHSDNKVKEDSYAKPNTRKRTLNYLLSPNIIINKNEKHQLSPEDVSSLFKTARRKELHINKIFEAEQTDVTAHEKETCTEYKVPSVLKRTTENTLHTSISYNTEGINGKDEYVKKRKTEKLPEHDLQNKILVNALIHGKSYSDVCKQRECGSSKRISEEIYENFPSKRIKEYMPNDCDKIQNEGEKKYHSNQAPAFRINKMIDASQTYEDNKILINTEFSEECYVEYIADPDFGKIRQNSRSAHDILKDKIRNENKNVSSEETCFLENLSPKHSSSLAKILVLCSSHSSGGVEQDFLEFV